MKINEIIDTEFIDTVDNTKALSKLGAGVYGSVSDTDDPFIVHKSTSRRSTQYDAYYRWVTAIAPYISENPYLPRVYVVNDNTEQSGSKPTYQIERLMNYTDVPLKVLIALYFKEAESPTDDYITRLKDTYFRERIRDEIWSDTLASVLAPDNKNKKIKQVLNILVNLIKRGEGKQDLHLGNFMIRLSPSGPQIVFTDPLQ